MASAMGATSPCRLRTQCALKRVSSQCHRLPRSVSGAIFAVRDGDARLLRGEEELMMKLSQPWIGNVSHLSDGREAKAKSGSFPVRCVSAVDNSTGSNDAEVASAVVSTAVIVVAVVVKAVVGAVKALGRTLIGTPLPDGSTNAENELVSALKGRLVLAVGPLFLASISQTPGSVSTPLTVVASGMAKWLEIYSGVLMVRVLLSWFPNIPWERQPLQAVRDMCDPYLNLFRNIIPPLFNALDLSPMLAFIVLGVLTSILNTTAR
ncbi:uncharacterized protein [Physcomitrium patens]|uniref:Uncharacterized protein n=1 Tax=Physcomitrium patens TaxID=3218 RepID=A0A2K1JH81_PHYPA|nr:ylmG homolog protein 1-2, chloroplastic-like [Physcomitrium patens]PNR40656.1 hypothetical protein PHYPA_018059 [Physcomitrium patens]|eukprot:XP_024395684.1 ylmG homolog protein 1-2, chloroplastic-like [Physcomitrella patens]